MNKRVILFLLAVMIGSGRVVFSGQAVEFVRYQINWPDYFPAFSLEQLDPAIKTDFQSPGFMGFAVPPSPKYSALFFDLRASADFNWSNLPTRDGLCTVFFKILSDVIPPNIEVSTGMTLFLWRENNIGGSYDWGSRRENRAEIISMRRESLDFMIVMDKTTNKRLPEQEAILLINRILDAGFSVEFFAEGHIQGATRFQVRTVSVHVTAIGKIKEY